MLGRSEELLRFAVFGVEVELDFAAGALFGRVDHAGIEGARVDVQADRALVKFATIHHAMNGIGGIDCAGLRDIHLDGVGGLKAATALLQILVNQMKIFHLQAPDGDGHPAVLIAMIMHRAGLADLPANGHQFVERGAVDEIASVVPAVPVEIGRERVGADGSSLEKATHGFDAVEGGLRELPQALDELLNGYRFRGGDHWVRSGCVPGERV